MPLRRRFGKNNQPRYGPRSLETLGLTFVSLHNGVLRVKDDTGGMRRYDQCFPGCPDTGRVAFGGREYFFISSSYPPLRNKTDDTRNN